MLRLNALSPVRLIAALKPVSQPWITRHCYRHEIVTALTFPTAIAMVEGGVIGVLAKKAFDVPPLLFAAIMAAPNFANLTSFIWARLARGRRKVPFINCLQVLALLSVAAIALLPTTGYGPLLLTGLIIFSRCLLSGIITIRSTVWRQNYPRLFRAQVTGKLAMLNSLIIAIAPLLGYMLLDQNPHAFRLLYPAAVIIAGIGVVSFARIRLRGEKDLLRYERRPAVTPQPHGAVAPVYEYDPDETTTFWQVLTRDRFYRNYLFWQFLAGSANMASETIVIYLIATITEGLIIGGLQIEYTTSILLSTAVPMLVAVLFLPIWARQLDQMHIAAFRTKQAKYWVLDQVLNWAAAMTWFVTQRADLALGMLFAARLVQGTARAGAMLAWNLGHNDFANRRLVVLYMGLHVTLTGIRGAIAPFAAITLYLGWEAITLPVLDLSLPAFDGLSHHLFLLTAACALASEFGFRRLAREVKAVNVSQND